ncbi:MAG: hypothetical protein FJX03_00725 [Alphaproteobacteria bacterium]|nr:hypothetical protein [Alphaproteobacteria bacterium]
MKTKTFNCSQDAGAYLALAVSQDLKEQIQSYERATWILPGGNSIKPFYPYFARLSLPWKRISFGLSDERCVPVEHDMSNERQLRENFLSYLKNYDYLPVNDRLVSIIRLYPPITVLSMGDDGHVASLFPEEAGIWKNEGTGIYVTKNQFPNRMSLTEETLLISRKIYIIVANRKKNKFLDQIDFSRFALNEIFEKSEIIRCLND